MKQSHKFQKLKATTSFRNYFFEFPKYSFVTISQAINPNQSICLLLAQRPTNGAICPQIDIQASSGCHMLQRYSSHQHFREQCACQSSIAYSLSLRVRHLQYKVLVLYFFSVQILFDIMWALHDCV